MRIIVCLKQMHHVFDRTSRDYTKNFIASSDEITCVNPFDLAALELALCLKDALADTKVLLLTLGPIIAEADLRRCLAMGADGICQIDSNGYLDGWATSQLLAEGVKELKGNLVLCGEKSMDSGSGQIGPFIAAHLGAPFVSRVTDVTVTGPGLPVQAERNGGRGKREIIECGLPAVFSATMGPKIPRYPSYENKRQLHQLPIRKLAVSGQKPPVKVTSIGCFSPRPRAKQVVPPDSSLPAYQRIEQLLRGSSIEKKGEMVKGDPEQQVERILSFLKEKDFLQSAEEDT